VQHLQKQGRQCIYLRVGNAEVLIGACFEHFQELRIAYLRGLSGSESHPIAGCIAFFFGVSFASGERLTLGPSILLVGVTAKSCSVCFGNFAKALLAE
jgi:hypothetical protein